MPCSAFECGFGGIFKDCTGSHCPRPLLLTAFVLVCWVAQSSQQHVPSCPPSLCLCTPGFSTLRSPKGERCLFTENSRSPAPAQTSKAILLSSERNAPPPSSLSLALENILKDPLFFPDCLVYLFKHFYFTPGIITPSLIFFLLASKPMNEEMNF